MQGTRASLDQTGIFQWYMVIHVFFLGFSRSIHHTFWHSGLPVPWAEIRWSHPSSHLIFKMRVEGLLITFMRGKRRWQPDGAVISPARLPSRPANWWDKAVCLQGLDSVISATCPLHLLSDSSSASPFGACGVRSRVKTRLWVHRGSHPGGTGRPRVSTRVGSTVAGGGGVREEVTRFPWPGFLRVNVWREGGELGGESLCPEPAFKLFRRWGEKLRMIFWRLSPCRSHQWQIFLPFYRLSFHIYIF